MFASNCNESRTSPAAEGEKNIFLCKQLIGEQCWHPWVSLEGMRHTTAASRALKQNVLLQNWFIPGSWRISSLPSHAAGLGSSAPMLGSGSPPYSKCKMLHIHRQPLRERLLHGGLGFTPAASILWSRCLQALPARHGAKPLGPDFGPVSAALFTYLSPAPRASCCW